MADELETGGPAVPGRGHLAAAAAVDWDRALRELTADLPAGPEGAPGPRPPAPPGQPDHAFSRLALASLLAALIPVYGTAAAIVMGHASRRRIRVTGERGARLAAAGLMIGYLTAAAYLAILLVMTVR